ncbi:hypothetical protein VKT23_012386 [Stygiomarasmius scandens]|uniref:Uncharacterized protein n=1 Tax=Marasmiellus scandens TaxID=2682957 RepID=A0ABR1J5W9_9AGAR
MPRRQLYFTKEQKAQAKREASSRYYQRNKSKIQKQNLRKYYRNQKKLKAQDLQQRLKRKRERETTKDSERQQIKCLVQQIVSKAEEKHAQFQWQLRGTPQQYFEQVFQTCMGDMSTNGYSPFLDDLETRLNKNVGKFERWMKEIGEHIGFLEEYNRVERLGRTPHQLLQWLYDVKCEGMIGLQNLWTQYERKRLAFQTDLIHTQVASSI